MAYDTLDVFENSKKVNGHEISDKSEFVRNIFIVKNNDSKLEIVRGNNRIHLDNEIGKSQIKLEDNGVTYEYSKVTIAKSTSSGVQKVTTIAPKYILINSTSKPLTIR